MPGLSADQMANRIVSNSERGMTTTVNDIEHIESQSLNGVAPSSRSSSSRTSTSPRQWRRLPPSATCNCAVSRQARRRRSSFSTTHRACPSCMLGLSGAGTERAAAVRHRHQHHPNATGHGRRRADALSLWRQAAPDPGGHRSGRAAGQGTLAGRCGECDQRAKPDCAVRHDEDRPVRVRHRDQLGSQRGRGTRTICPSRR